MKERPILFSAPMVRAILDGRKTQTRRPVKGASGQPYTGDVTNFGTCKFGQPGDRLWVREAWGITNMTRLNDGARHDQVTYRAGKLVHRSEDIPTPIDFSNWPTSWADDFIPDNKKWRPSIHMPRWASRITLEITGVRVERLQDISERDAWAEGCEGFDDDVSGGKSGYSEFAELWESINGPGSWDANPWVWVVEFKLGRIIKRPKE